MSASGTLSSKIERLLQSHLGKVGNSFATISGLNGNTTAENTSKGNINQMETNVVLDVSNPQRKSIPTTLGSSVSRCTLFPELSETKTSRVKEDKGPGCQFVIEKAMKIDVDRANHYIDAGSASEQPEPERHLMIDTKSSETKIRTTTPSFRTDNSSLDHLVQDQLLNSAQKAVLVDHKGESLVTHTLQSKSDTFPGLRLQKQETMNTNDCTIKTTLGASPSQISMTPNNFTLSTWTRKALGSSLTASAPEFRPQLSKNVKIENGFLGASTSEPVFTPDHKPLAMESGPTDQLSGSEANFAGEETCFTRPQLTMEYPALLTLNIPDQRNNTCLQEYVKYVDRPFLFIGENGRVMTEHGQTLKLTATISSISSSSLDNTSGKTTPDEGFSSTQFLLKTTPEKVESYDRSTFVQRQAGRQLAQSQMRPSQSAPGTVKLEPASLIVSQAPGKTENTRRLRSSFGAPTLPGQHHLVSHSQSLTWKRPTKPECQGQSVNPELAKWTKVEQNLLRMGLIKRVPGKLDSGSFVCPKNFEQWLEFRAGQAKDSLERNAAKVQQKTNEMEMATRIRKAYSMDNIHGFEGQSRKHSGETRVGQAMSGKCYRDGRGTVLAHPSTWSPWYQPTDGRPEALWPCAEEMKEEGDERHTSAFGRFLALPRVPGNPTVVWKVKPVIPALPFDEVWKVPDKHTWAELHVQKSRDLQEEDMNALIGQTLLDAVNS